MVPYVFLCDIDGTLHKDGQPIPTKVVAAANAFTAAGGLLALCTGRSAVAALPIVQAMGVNCPCIFYGGAALYDWKSQTFLHTRPMSGQVRSVIAEVLEKKPTVSVQVFTAQGGYTLRRNDYLNAHGVKAENNEPLRQLNEISGEILKLVMCCENPEEMESSRHYFDESTYNFSFASRHFVDVVGAGCGKEYGMRMLAKKMDIPLDHFFAAGDGMTDIPMLQLAHMSFAPSNGLPPVREVANVVVPSVLDGGMVEAFHRAREVILR